MKTAGIGIAAIVAVGALAAVLSLAVGPISFVPLVALAGVGMALAWRTWPAVRQHAILLAGGMLLSMLAGATLTAMLEVIPAGRVASCRSWLHTPEVKLDDGREIAGLDAFRLPAHQQACLPVGITIEKRRLELDLRTSGGTLPHRIRGQFWGALSLLLIGVEWLRRRRPFLPGRRLLDPSALWLEPWRRDVLAALPALVLLTVGTALVHTASHPMAYVLAALLWLAATAAYDPCLVRLNLIHTVAVWRARRIADRLGGRVVRGRTRGGVLHDGHGVRHVWSVPAWRGHPCPATDGLPVEVIGRGVPGEDAGGPFVRMEALDDRPLLVTLLRGRAASRLAEKVAS